MINHTFGIIRTKSLVNRFTIRCRIIKMIENQEYVQYTWLEWNLIEGIVVRAITIATYYSYSCGKRSCSGNEHKLLNRDDILYSFTSANRIEFLEINGQWYYGNAHLRLRKKEKRNNTETKYCCLLNLLEASSEKIWASLFI